MEKSEGRKEGSSPARSSPRRPAYNMLSSIINLSSPPVKTTGGESSKQPLPPSFRPPVHPKVPNGNHHPTRISSDEPKKQKKSNQYPSNGSGRTPATKGPMGPAPRTLSILTALNELAIRDRPGVPCPTEIIRSGLPPPTHLLRQRAPLNLPTSPPIIPSSRPNPPHPPTVMSTGKNNDQEDMKDDSSAIYSSPTSIRHQQHNSSSNSSSSRSIINNASIPPFAASTPRRPTTKAFEKNSRLARSINSLHHQRSKSKERTPDWIWKIFQLAKHGKLEELQLSLKTLEPVDPTMLRHLVDGKGNTLLHCAARAGHVLVLQWLVSILGPHMDAVLNDKNRAGRNVILTALKGGQLKCFQWLVLQCIGGDKGLVPKEGERSLLHFAANYGNEPAVRWLVEQMAKRNVSVDMKDSSGFTPLHMAAKSGSISVCHTLITLAAADPHSEMELGWRPSDLALRHRHIECANYLVMTEAASSLGTELYQLISAYKNVQKEHELLRLHFREVLRVGKSLVKERVDLIKSFPSSSAAASKSLNATTADPAVLLLGGGAGGNNGARFSELEHKLVKAEQAWKRMEVQVGMEDKFGAGTAVTTSSSAASPVTSGSGGGGGGGNEPAHSSPLHVDFLVENTNSPTILQKRLAGLQSRRDKNFTSQAFLSASSSDAESSATSTSSSEDDDDDRLHNLRHHQHPHEHQNPRTRLSRSGHAMRQLRTTPNNSGSSATSTPNRSGNAPWLLPPDDHLLAALSPIVNHIDGTEPRTKNMSGNGGGGNSSLDLLRITSPPNKNPAVPYGIPIPGPFSRGRDTSANQRPLEQLGKVDTEDSSGQNDTPEIAVLEVIEPGKGPYFTPDLLRRSSHCQPKASPSSFYRGCPSPVYSSTSHSGLEDIYGEIKGIPSGRRSNASSSCDEHVNGSKTEMVNPLCQSTRVSLTASYVTLPRAASDSGAQCKKIPPIPFSSASLNNKHCSLQSQTHFLKHSACSCENFSSFQHSSLIYSNDKNELLQEPAQDVLSMAGKEAENQEEITESVSAANTPIIIKRSHSSASCASTTVLFPPKTMWRDGDQTERSSPSLSEASRTESALVPPSSFTSQNSEASKTESVLELKKMKVTEPEDEEQEEAKEEEDKVDYSRSGPAVFLNDSNYSTANDLSTAVEARKGKVGVEEESIPVVTMRSNCKQSCDNNAMDAAVGTRRKNQDILLPETTTTPRGGKAVENCSNEASRGASAIVRSHGRRGGGGTSGHERSGIQRSSKSRGPPKPWYEIEGSDEEEGSHLLRVARGSRSVNPANIPGTNTSGRHLASSLSSENETETSEEQESSSASLKTSSSLPSAFI